MNSRNRLLILGAVTIVLVILVITFFYFSNTESVRVDFDNIENYDGKRVIIKGFLGENISLQQHLQGGRLDDSKRQYYFLYPGEKPLNERIILVFDNNDFPYMDKGAFICVTGKVDVSDSGAIYLHVIKINW